MPIIDKQSTVIQTELATTAHDKVSDQGEEQQCMKKLTIIRHAKAVEAAPALTDFERPLTKRGLKDAERIGKLLAELTPPVDWLLSSPALRTRETTTALVESLGYQGRVQWAESAYLAEAEIWLNLLGHLPPEVEHVTIVGHNPGIADLVAGLAAGMAPRLNLAFPTAALAHLELEIFWWNQIRWGCGQLQLLLTPRALRK